MKSSYSNQSIEQPPLNRVSHENQQEKSLFMNENKIPIIFENSSKTQSNVKKSEFIYGKETPASLQSIKYNVWASDDPYFSLDSFQDVWWRRSWVCKYECFTEGKKVYLRVYDDCIVYWMVSSRWWLWVTQQKNFLALYVFLSACDDLVATNSGIAIK